MFIFFIGPACSGKTTLIKELSQYYNVPIIYEVVEDVLKELNISWELLKDKRIAYIFQKRILEHMEQHILYNSDQELVFMDRSPIEVNIYSLLLNIEPEKFIHLNLKTLEILRGINYLNVYFEPLPFKDSRHRNAEYYKKGERRLYEQLIKPHADIVLPVLPVEQRLEYLLARLSDYGIEF